MSSMNTSSWIGTLLVIQQQTIRYLYSLYLILGVTGCCLNILLFSQQKFRTVSCCTYFLAASVAMALNLGWGIGSTMYTLNNVDPNTTIVAFCKLRIYVSQVIALPHRWSMTAACFDRYALSSANARLRGFARVHVARRVVGVVVIVWLILPVHTLVLYNLKAGACGIFNDTAAALYHSIFTTLVSCVFPASIMFGCALLIRQNLSLKRQRRQLAVNLPNERQDDAENLNRTRDHQILVMLFTQVIVYVISVIPLMVFYIYTAVTVNITNKPLERISIERFAAFTAEAMIFLFPVSSFYLYTMSSHTFRNELIRLLRSALGCRGLNSIHPIASGHAVGNIAGHLPIPLQVSKSHVPNQVVLGHLSEIGESEGNVNQDTLL